MRYVVDASAERPVARHAEPLNGWKMVLLLLGAVVAAGAWFLAAHGLIAEYRPELVGASFSSDIKHPDRFVVRVCAFFVAVGAAVALLLIFRPKGARASRMAVAALLVAGLLALGVNAVVTAPATRCAFDSYADETGACVPRRDAIVTDLLTIFVPGTAVVACLIVGAKRGNPKRLS